LSSALSQRDGGASASQMPGGSTVKVAGDCTA
jgi:hypothetical protein